MRDRSIRRRRSAWIYFFNADAIAASCIPQNISYAGVSLPHHVWSAGLFGIDQRRLADLRRLGDIRPAVEVLHHLSDVSQIATAGDFRFVFRECFRRGLGNGLLHGFQPLPGVSRGSLHGIAAS